MHKFLQQRASAVHEVRLKDALNGRFSLDMQPVPLPRGGGFWGLIPPKQSSKYPQIETWNTINQLRFCQFLECHVPAPTQIPPRRNANSPYWKLSGDGSACSYNGSSVCSVWKLHAWHGPVASRWCYSSWFLSKDGRRWKTHAKSRYCSVTCLWF